MVAIFVAAASAAANKNNYSGKQKRKTATTSLLKNCIPNSFQDGQATTPAQSSKGHRGVATHSLEPCKFPCQAEEETQHKLQTNCTAGQLHLLD
jgi:hypothetical protein